MSVPAARAGRRLATLGLTVLALAVLAGRASAHGTVGGGLTPPIPLWALYGGAGLTVASTAGWLAVTDGRDERTAGRPTWTLPAWVGRVGAILGRSLGLLALGVVVAAGLTGRQVPATNPATVVFWSLWLKGVGLVAVLAGSPWRVVSPWGTLYDALARVEGADPALLETYPGRLDAWPALVGYLLVVGVVENLTTVPRSPRLTAALVAAYALVMVLGAVAFGREWLRRADLFAVLYRLLGRVAPLAVSVTAAGTVVEVRAPWRDCVRPVADRSVAAVVVAALYTVSFDGLRETLVFQTVLAAVGGAGATGPVALGLYLVGLALFLGSFAAATGLVDRIGGSRGASETTTAVAASVLPIAAAYEVAHTYPFVLQSLGLLARQQTGGATAVSGLGAMPVAAVWGSQIALVVVGHLVAVVAAHAVTRDRYGTTAGRRAHVPLVALMVGFTVLSLWILSQPVVG